jgi:hypothetical protein
MAEGDCTVYQSFIVGVLSADIDCTTGPFWMTLHTGLAINQAHETYADVDGVLEYGTAGGYTAGGKVCATPTVTKAAAIKFDADDPATWTALLLATHPTRSCASGYSVRPTPTAAIIRWPSMPLEF